MKELFEEAGFTKYEAQLYLCLLQNGTLNAYQVAEKTGLYPQVCYDTLNRLSEKGYVTELKEGRTTLFRAAKPELILEEIKAKAASFEEALPKLLALKKDANDPIEIELFKGKNVLRLALGDIVKTLRKTGGENCCTAVNEEMFNTLDKVAMERYQREMLKYHLKERVILQQGTKGLFPSTMTEYRTIPQKYFNPVPVQVYGDKVQILLGGVPNNMILIHNKNIADSFRKQFELMWSIAKKT
jgi:sugar-specific transcriptional regulator TrmB